VVEVGLVGVEDAGAAGPPADQQVIGARDTRETAHGVAGQAQLAGDGPQSEPLVEQGVDGRVLFADPVRVPA
jgi:hypothetical protein